MATTGGSGWTLPRGGDLLRIFAMACSGLIYAVIKSGALVACVTVRGGAHRSSPSSPRSTPRVAVLPRIGVAGHDAAVSGQQISSQNGTSGPAETNELPDDAPRLDSLPIVLSQHCSCAR